MKLVKIRLDSFWGITPMAWQARVQAAKRIIFGPSTPVKTRSKTLRELTCTWCRRLNNLTHLIINPNWVRISDPSTTLIQIKKVKVQAKSMIMSLSKLKRWHHKMLANRPFIYLAIRLQMRPVINPRASQIARPRAIMKCWFSRPWAIWIQGL